MKSIMIIKAKEMLHVPRKEGKNHTAQMTSWYFEMHILNALTLFPLSPIILWIILDGHIRDGC